MRLYTFLYRDQTRIGCEHDGHLVDLTDAVGTNDMVQFIRQGDAGLNAARTYLSTKPDAARPAGAGLPFDAVTLQAPVRPTTVWCSGLNYRSHVLENPNATFLDEPRFFAKLANTIIGPDQPILHPGERFLVDYEVELAVVIGKTARRLTQPTAMEHVYGYTILHDVGARYVQFKDNNEMMGKNFDTFCPIGPCLVTADEIPKPDLLRLSLTLNGKTMQDGSNEEWLFSLPRMLEWLTMACTMQPGDIMSTGTPLGIGYFQKPQVFLKPGDVCALTISGIGTLTNSVAADPYAFLTEPHS